MPKTTSRPFNRKLEARMAEKTALLSKAHAFMEMGMVETAQPLWAQAAEREERIAPLLDAVGREDEAALHRISAASCHYKAGDLSRAANMYRAALAGPLRSETRAEIERSLRHCLAGIEP